jgi:hypothetical protein
MPGPGAVFNLVPPLAPTLRGGDLLIFHSFHSFHSFHFNMNGGFVSSGDTVVIEYTDLVTELYSKRGASGYD